MTREGRARVFKHGAARTLYVAVPAAVASDSACPLREGQEVRVELVVPGQRVRVDAGPMGAVLVRPAGAKWANPERGRRR